jgi:signal transduction histidine kinase
VVSVPRTVLIDTAAFLLVTAINDVSIAAGTVRGHPQGLADYAFGAVLALPSAFWRRWPLSSLLGASTLMILYYAVGSPGISPTATLAIPLYGAAVAGRMWWALGVTAFFYIYGVFDVWLAEHQRLLSVIDGFVVNVALGGVTILLGEVVRNRRALAEESRERLRAADQERENEAARRVAEERVRIARELHDTVAHSMATITVQAGSALHVLPTGGPDTVRTALSAIRDTSKDALQELRATLGLLREGAVEPDAFGKAGLDRLPALLDAVRAAGVPVTLEVHGRAVPLEPSADHSAYRILQESLTNVLRHGGPKVRASVRMAYDHGGLAIEVVDDGLCDMTPGGDGGGHGLGGMRERAEAVGGTLTAGPRPGGGFVVSARIPVAAS